MAQARRVPIPCRARITGASLTTSTGSIQSTNDASAMRHSARPIPVSLIDLWFALNVTDAGEPAVPVVAGRGA
jgi:hypothetical protein